MDAKLHRAGFSQIGSVNPRLLDAFFKAFAGVFLSGLEDQNPRVWLLAFGALSAARRRYRKTADAVADLAASVDVRLNAKVDAVRGSC